MIKSRDKQVFEILDEVDQLPTDEAKIQHLQQHYSDHTPLHYVLKFAFCDTIQSIIPEGEPPFNTEEVDGPSHGNLWMYLKQFPLYVVSQQSQNMRSLQRERIFIEMLEALDIREAKMFCLAKDKQLHTAFQISSYVAQQAFPQMGITVSEPIVAVEKTPEEKAQALLDLAKMKKEQAKELNAEARKLTAEAKSLTE